MLVNLYSRIPNASRHQVTELDNNKKLASEVLKRVDQLIRAKNLEKALLETTHAKQIDPRNVYAFALEERIQDLLAEQTKTQQEKEQMKIQAELETKSQQECNTKTLMQIPVIAIQNINQTISSVTSTVSHLQHSMDPPTGRIPNEFQRKPLFAPVTDSRNKGKDKQIRRLPKIVIIDDDKDLLSVLSTSIESGGFEVIPLTTSDEAYVLLKKFTPDIILCDVNLETSTMGGFTFFEKVQEIEHLKQVPFIFLTGLSDDVLIRTGKEMGADDYLTKPIKENNLLAALRGKLKRFAQLQRTQPLEVIDPVAAFPRGEVHL